jgi:pyruvate, orthophosphate dikinase
MDTKLQSRITRFGKHGTEGSKLAAVSLGLKGAALCQMAKLKLAVPPGFILTVEACRELAAAPENLTSLKVEIAQALQVMAQETGFALGDPKNLLVVAVRPSAPVSHPGSLEAVLNLGLNDTTVEGLAKSSGDPGFAHECYRRFIQNYAHIVLGDDPAAFDDVLALYMEEHGYVSATEIKTSDAREITAGKSRAPGFPARC